MGCVAVVYERIGSDHTVESDRTSRRLVYGITALSALPFAWNSVMAVTKSARSPVRTAYRRGIAVGKDSWYIFFGSELLIYLLKRRKALLIQSALKPPPAI